MRSSSARSSVNPGKVAAGAADGPVADRPVLRTSRGKIAAVPSKSAAKAIASVGRQGARHVDGLVDLASSSITVHDAVMQGVSGRVLARIWVSTKGALPADAVLRAIGLSERTAHRIKSDPDKRLDARTTDGIYRFESIRALAQDVLGSVEAADEWLNSEALGLELRKPIDLMSSSPGSEAVKTLLQRMKYGVYA